VTFVRPFAASSVAVTPAPVKFSRARAARSTVSSWMTWPLPVPAEPGDDVPYVPGT
jgi:hypothetical protein